MVTKTKVSGRYIPLESRQDLAKRIDETKLVFNPRDDQEAVIRALCENALKEEFRSVCVRPQHVALAKRILNGSPVMVATVIAFPQGKALLEDQRKSPTFGDVPWEGKVAEMRQAMADGADEFDIVMNIPFFKQVNRTLKDPASEFELVRLVEGAQGIPVKLIIETDLLTDEEIAQATQMSIAAGIDFVKTSTGMLEGGKGATVPNIALIYKTIQASPVTKKPGIKASGGVRTACQAFELIQAGADVIGSSAGSQLLDDFEAKNHVEFNL